MADAPTRTVLRLLLGTALLLWPLALRAADASDWPWYQVEIVLFANSSAGAATSEQLVTDAALTQSPTALALGPPWPAAARPERLRELQMLWDSAGVAPRLDRVTPGLDPETERLIAWLRRLNARSRAPDLDWLYGLELLEWRGEVEAGADILGDGDGVEIAEAIATDTIGADGAARDAAPDDTAIPAAEAEPPAFDPADLDIPVALAFREVPQDQRLLNEDAARLRRARDFQVLEHIAWRQPFEAEAAAIPVLVQWRDPSTGELMLHGSVGVALRRYLHVEFDLLWRELDAAQVALAETEPAGVWAPIRQSRRMRSGELHYVDHPRIGALIRITPFALAAPLRSDAPVAATLGN